MNDLALARIIASKFHIGQTYGKNDYMFHLDQVVKSLQWETDERLQVIAMLHDILEDTTCTKEVLYGLFEDNVVEAIIAISKVDGESYQNYIKRVKSNMLAKTVKMHDTLCNLTESLHRKDMKRVIKYSRQMEMLAQ